MSHGDELAGLRHFAVTLTALQRQNHLFKTFYGVLIVMGRSVLSDTQWLDQALFCTAVDQGCQRRSAQIQNISNVVFVSVARLTYS